MAYKINDLTALGRNLGATDLLEVSLAGATGSRKITGAQIIAAAGAPAWLESNATDLTIWNNGKGNIASNTSFGDGALKSNTTGSNNVAIGVNALALISTGTSNIGIGRNAANNLTQGGSNIAIGDLALSSMVANVNENTAIGNQALRQLNDGTSFRNTSIGSGSLNNAVIQVESVAVGTWAILSNSGGGQNVAIGKSALQNGGASTNNTIVGWQSGDAITTGIQNTSIGSDSLGACTTGSRNTTLGFNAGLALVTVSDNTLIGSSAGNNITNGGSNTCIGSSSRPRNGSVGASVSIGQNSIGPEFGVAIGFNATASHDNSLILGAYAGTTAANQISIGSTTVPLGTLTTETLSSTKTLTILLNGVPQKILLA